MVMLIFKTNLHRIHFFMLSRVFRNNCVKITSDLGPGSYSSTTTLIWPFSSMS